MDLRIIQVIEKYIDPDSTSIINKYTNMDRNEILEKIQKNKPLFNALEINIRCSIGDSNSLNNLAVTD